MADDALEMKNFYKVLEEYSDRVKQLYSNKLEADGRKATGNLINSVSVNIKVFDETVNVVFSAADYFQQLENGRGPTQNDGDGAVQRNILQWIKAKGIVPSENKDGRIPTEEQLSYAIANKIHREGYKGGNYLASTVEELNAQYLPMLEEALQEDLYYEYDIQVMDAINKIKI